MVPLWGAATSEEESRAYLQERLTVLWKIMFWAYVILIGTQALLYEFGWFEIHRPDHQRWIYVTATIGLTLMAVIWRGVLLRRKLPMNALTGLDTFYAVGSGSVLGAAALLAWEFPPSHYVCLIYAAFAVFTRAILLPSTGRRTTFVAILTFAPVDAAAVVLAKWNAAAFIPGPVFATAAIVLSGVAVLLAATGSSIIYDLRQKATAAKQLGSYFLEKKIGSGGMGEVYRAHHVLLRRPTAVKRLLPERVGSEENLARFEREVHAMSKLTHPNTVAVYDYGRGENGGFYYAMEYLGGGINLEDLVKTRGPQPSGRVVHILVQVCGALQEAHEEKLLHRDIKPPNIILCQRGGIPDVAKVVDFGLVKDFAEDNGASTQVILGTPAYIAPEALESNAMLGPGVDLYSLGAVGYFLLTGRKVFEGKTAVEQIVAHATAIPKRPSEVAKIRVARELEDILMRCLAKKPEDRYASAEELAAALRALPPSTDWDEAEAKRWWRDFKVQEEAAISASEMETIQITVDLERRDGFGT